MPTDPLILYIPGLKPKPPPELHREQLRRCLLAGLRHADRDAAESVARAAQSFDVASWTYDFYSDYRDIALDLPGIDALLARGQADAEDIATARSWQRRLLRAVYRTGDRLPFLIPRLADENMELYLRDINRYVRDRDGAATRARQSLEVPLRAALAAGRPVLLAAHSMGSVIAWDVLWELGRGDVTGRVDLFLTLGSPLGQRFVQRRLLGAGESGAARYTDRIRRWTNIAAVGELTALDRQLANDYQPMLSLGLIEAIDDVEIYNWFRYDNALNVHAEYGYLANRDTAACIANWWRRQLA